jgi:D-alanine transaminase
VREAGSANIFAVLDGVLRTHPADHSVLDGVTRRKILEIAGGVGVPAVQAAVKVREFEAADEAFLSSTTRGILPVVRIGGRPVGDGRPGPVTLRLADGLRAEVARLAGAPAPSSLRV